MDHSRPPAPWSIEPGNGPSDEILRLGQRTLRLSDIDGCESQSTAELNVDGHFAALALFMMAGAGLVLLVALGVLSSRFLAGGVLFTGIGLMVLLDMLRGHRVIIHRVVIRLAGGASELFASPHAAECRALVSALESRARRR